MRSGSEPMNNESGSSYVRSRQAVGAHLRRLRLLSSLSLHDVADRISRLGMPVSPSTVSRIELGQSAASSDLLLALSETLGASFGELEEIMRLARARTRTDLAGLDLPSLRERAKDLATLGDYAAALDLLVDLHAMGHPFTHIGITGYPESHPTIDDDVTVQSMWDKRRYATHIVSNMTFDAEHLSTWSERVRRRGVDLPLVVGVPGPVERTKLLGMATKIGVGESLRFLRKQRSVFARIAAPGFSTDRFVSRVAALSANPALGIDGLHVFTFNQVDVVEAWRQRMLADTVAARTRPR